MTKQASQIHLEIEARDCHCQSQRQATDFRRPDRIRTEFACVTLAGLAFNKILRKLDIHVKFLNEPFVGRLREMLQVNRSIKSLVVRGSGMAENLLNAISALLNPPDLL